MAEAFTSVWNWLILCKTDIFFLHLSQWQVAHWFSYVRYFWTRVIFVVLNGINFFFVEIAKQNEIKNDNNTKVKICFPTDFISIKWNTEWLSNCLFTQSEKSKFSPKNWVNMSSIIVSWTISTKNHTLDIQSIFIWCFLSQLLSYTYGRLMTIQQNENINTTSKQKYWIVNKNVFYTM